MNELWKWEVRFSKALASIEQNGVLVDQELARQELAIGQAELLRIEDALGGKPSSSKFLQKFLIEERGLPVYYNSKTGNPTFDKKAMEKYEEILEYRGDESAKEVLAYRGYQKAGSTYFRSFLDFASPLDGRVRTSLKNHVARTSRLSSEKPNFQNIPKETDDSKPWNRLTKQALIAPEGWTLYELDYANLEFRLAAAYAKETALIEAFNNDISMWDVMMEQTGMCKADVKTLTYCLNYGGGIGRLMEIFGVSRNEAIKIRKDYFAPYPNLQKKAKIATLVADRDGYVTFWTGRRRHFANESTHKAWNAYLQGGAAEVVKRALVRIFEEVCGDSCRLVLTVHDSIVLEVRNGREQEFLPRAQRIMTEVPPAAFGVKFTSSIHRWGSEEEWSVAA